VLFAGIRVCPAKLLELARYAPNIERWSELLTAKSAAQTADGLNMREVKCEAHGRMRCVDCTPQLAKVVAILNPRSVVAAPLDVDDDEDDEGGEGFKENS